MYSGTTLNKTSGKFIGVHQRINHLARRNFGKLYADDSFFPTAKEINYFEGNNGPDGIKRKSPGVDEPWHFIDPTDPDDLGIVKMITEHYQNLVEALKKGNRERIAFEASWLSHTIVDGLTPAHHYPLAKKIEELWGKPQSERISKIEKNFIKGASMKDSFSKNWQYWGAKGIFSTHLLFEMGVASSITTHRFLDTLPTDDEIEAVKDQGIEETFLEAVHYIYQLDMYHEFWKQGWTTNLALKTRRELLPVITWYLSVVWCLAAIEAGHEA